LPAKETSLITAGIESPPGYVRETVSAEELIPPVLLMKFTCENVNSEPPVALFDDDTRAAPYLRTES